MADDRAEPLRPDSPVQVIMVNVIAPATLPAGYEFEAQVQGDPEMTVHAVVVRMSIMLVAGYSCEAPFSLVFLTKCSLKEVLLKEKYLRFPWKRTTCLEDCESRHLKATGRTACVDVAIMAVAINISGVPFAAPTVS